MESSALHYFFSPGQGLLFCILITKQKKQQQEYVLFLANVPFPP